MNKAMLMAAIAAGAVAAPSADFTWSVTNRACGDGDYGTTASAGYPESSGNITEVTGTLPIEAITKASSNGWQAYCFMRGACTRTGTLHVEIDYTIGAGGEGVVELLDEAGHETDTGAYQGDAAGTLTLDSLPMVSGVTALKAYVFVRHNSGSPTTAITAIRYTWS